jgi:LCP family protein required for cell wall assembly
MMLLRTDPGGHRISYLSIPRDLYVDIPGHGRNKINTAYQIGGAVLQLRTVKQFTGLEVDHIALVDFGSFRDLIDAIGGVTVNNPKPILSNRFDCPYTAAKCADWKGWSFGKGEIHLDGRRALAYSRVRENRLDAADTDFTRGERQQQVISAIGAKLASAGTFARLPFIGDDLLKPLATDLSAWQILQLGWVRFRSSTGKALHCRLGGDPSTAGATRRRRLPAGLHRRGAGLELVARRRLRAARGVRAARRRAGRARRAAARRLATTAAAAGVGRAR